MRKLAFGMLTAVAVVCATEAQAQNPTVPSRTATASITIPSLLHIDVTNLNPSFNSPTFDDFDVGYVNAPTSSVISTRANVVHDVMIEAANATMTGPYAKLAEDLRWSIDGFAASDNGLTNAPVGVLTALSQGIHSNVATVDYRMLLNDAQDLPGTYTLSFTYTVVAN